MMKAHTYATCQLAHISHAHPSATLEDRRNSLILQSLGRGRFQVPDFLFLLRVESLVLFHLNLVIIRFPLIIIDIDRFGSDGRCSAYRCESTVTSACYRTLSVPIRIGFRFAANFGLGLVRWRREGACRHCCSLGRPTKMDEYAGDNDLLDSTRSLSVVYAWSYPSHTNSPVVFPGRYQRWYNRAMRCK